MEQYQKVLSQAAPVYLFPQTKTLQMSHLDSILGELAHAVEDHAK